MKKYKQIISAILAVCMLAVLAPSTCFAKTKDNVKEIKLGEILHISMEDNNPNMPYAELRIKFIPNATGMYEFSVFNDTITSPPGCMWGEIYNKLGTQEGNSGILYNQGDIDNYIYGSPLPIKNDSVAAELTKNKEYYLVLNCGGLGKYSADLTVKKGHECTFHKNIIEAGAYNSCDDGDGYLQEICLSCQKRKVLKTYYAYKKVILSKTKYIYDGKSKKPKAVVYDRKGGIIDSSNYDVIYSTSSVDNTVSNDVKNVGYGYVHIVFNGKIYNRYGGMTSIYKIVPQSTTLSSVKSTYNGFKVTWKKQATQTTGYQIKYSTNSEFKNAKYVTVSGTKNLSKTISNLKGNTKYYVKVRTYKKVRNDFYDEDEKLYSSWSKSKSVVTKAVKGTSLSKVTPLSKGFKASWKKQTSGTNGYQIKYSTSSKFKNAKYVTIKSTKTTSKTVKKLKAKKKYYVKVRTYKIVNGKRCYSAWSTSKAVTTKK